MIDPRATRLPPVGLVEEARRLGPGRERTIGKQSEKGEVASEAGAAKVEAYAVVTA